MQQPVFPFDLEKHRPALDENAIQRFSAFPEYALLFFRCDEIRVSAECLKWNPTVADIDKKVARFDAGCFRGTVLIHLSRKRLPVAIVRPNAGIR
jgi:hypothetical protein